MIKKEVFTFAEKTLSTSRDGLGCRECKVVFEDAHGNLLVLNAMNYEDWNKYGPRSNIKVSIETINEE